MSIVRAENERVCFCITLVFIYESKRRRNSEEQQGIKKTIFVTAILVCATRGPLTNTRMCSYLV